MLQLLAHDAIRQHNDAQAGISTYRVAVKPRILRAPLSLAELRPGQVKTHFQLAAGFIWVCGALPHWTQS